MGQSAARETERANWATLLVYELSSTTVRAGIIWFWAHPAAWVIGLLLISPGLFALSWPVPLGPRESMWRLAKLVDAFTQVALCAFLVWVGVPERWWLPLLLTVGLAYLVVAVTRWRDLQAELSA